jgi:acyl-CoA synthetase (NDP forming)
VAVIGAGRGERGVGQAVLRNLLRGDFTGPVYPVHPTATAVAGVRAYPTVLDIPDDVDLAVVAVPAEAVPEVVGQCARKGVRGLVVVSAGFGETGPEGRARQEDLVRLARAHGMRVVGPNCLGVANTDPEVRLNATLAPTLPGRGPVGFFSQSGALGIAILQRTAERGIGLSTFVSAGNRADVSGNDLMQYWEKDPATGALLLYLESLGNPRKFTRLARRLSRTKPIVAVKSGRTTQGVPLGHAAHALTLPDHAVSALFAQAGVIRVEDLAELFDVAQLLAHQPLPGGDRVAIIDNSDSLRLLAQDAARALGLDPQPAAEVAGGVGWSGKHGRGNTVGKTRPGKYSLGAGAGPAEFENALAGALADDSCDAVVIVYAPPVVGPGPAGQVAGADAAVAEVIAGLAGDQDDQSRKPVVASFLGMTGMPAALRVPGPDGAAGPGSVPSYPAPEDAVRALAYVTRYAAWRRRPYGRVPDPENVDRDRARALVHRLLGDAAASVDAPAAAAAELLACYGVTVGGDGPGGGIPGGGIATRITTAEDPSFGAVVSFGLADIAADLLDDRAYRLAPLTDVEAGEMVRAVRTAPLLFGHRGADPVDVAALEELLWRVARLSDDLPEVARLALDPVVAAPPGVHVGRAELTLSRPVGPRYDIGPRRLRDL